MAGAGSVSFFGNIATGTEWTNLLASPEPTTYRVTRVDTASAGNNQTIAEMDALLNAPMNGFVWYFSPFGNVMQNDDATFVDAYNVYISNNSVVGFCEAFPNSGDLAFCIASFTP